MVSREVPQRGMVCLFPFFFFFLFSRSFHVLPYLSRSEISPSSASSASQRGDKSASGAPRASIFFSLRNVPSPRERDRVPGFVGQFLLPWNFLSGIPVCTLYTRSGRRWTVLLLLRDLTFMTKPRFDGFTVYGFPCFNMCESFPRVFNVVHIIPSSPFHRLFLARWIAYLAIYLLPPSLLFFRWKNEKRISLSVLREKNLSFV